MLIVRSTGLSAQQKLIFLQGCKWKIKIFKQDMHIIKVLKTKKKHSQGKKDETRRCRQSDSFG